MKGDNMKIFQKSLIYFSMLASIVFYNSITKANNDFIIENGVLQKYSGPGGSVMIPGNITEIGSEAFMSCDTVTAVVIPNSVKSIGDLAFYACEKLEQVKISNSII